jgi:hypothetical protein
MSSPEETGDAAPLGWTIPNIARAAETSLRSVRDAVARGDLDTACDRPLRISDRSARAFIAACRDARSPELRAAAGDLIDRGYTRPYEIAEMFGIQESAILTAIQLDKLAAIGRGVWLFVSISDAANYAESMAGRKAA